MKHVSTTDAAATATLRYVMDGIAANPNITATRKRDLRSAIISFGSWRTGRPSLSSSILGR